VVSCAENFCLFSSQTPRVFTPFGLYFPFNRCLPSPGRAAKLFCARVMIPDRGSYCKEGFAFELYPR
jgi:hypothetical protein